MNATRVAAAHARAGLREQLIATLPVSERRLTLNGVGTAVLEGGAGNSLVLLHGPGAYAAQFLEVIPELVKTHRIIAPDLPGHGESDFFDGELLPERVNGWLDDLIECTCTEPPVLVGYTLGGAIAARFAADHGSRVSALVLVDALGLAQFKPEPAFGAALAAFLAHPDGSTHDALWEQCAFDYSTLQRRIGSRWSLIREYTLDRARRPGGIAAVAAWMERVGSPALPDSVLERIRVPCTLVWGREDRATPLSVAREIHARYGWPLHVVDGAADDPTVENPREFLRILRGSRG
ncbi:MAG TPA: alpha/beta hydrolase [Steroidobacteraceae bacterium]|jgi:pimeloyl-ACP methyl ester carboxylesterase